MNRTPTSTAVASPASTVPGTTLEFQIVLVVLEGEAAAPVPDRETVAGVFEALLTRDTLPVTLVEVVGANFTWNVALCPAASVAGSVRPLMLKPVPVTVACEMVTLAVLAVTVTFCVLLLPTVTLPKLRELGLAARVPAGLTPLPVRAIELVVVEALLVNATLPVALPEVVGANFTWKVALCPAASVAGSVRPLMVNPVPLTVACEMVTLAVLAVTVMFCVLLLPTVTLPKLSEVGLAVRVPAGLTPLPLRAIEDVEVEALLTSERLPEAVPAVVGANFTWKVVLCPAAIVAGSVRPLMLKPVPVTFACETVTLEVPAVRVTFCVVLLPTVTLPKLSELVLSASVPVEVVVLGVKATSTQ